MIFERTERFRVASYYTITLVIEDDEIKYENAGKLARQIFMREYNKTCPADFKKIAQIILDEVTGLCSISILDPNDCGPIVTKKIVATHYETTK